MITSSTAFNQNVICWFQKSSSLNMLRFKVTYYELLDPGQTASIPCCNKNLAHLNWILKEKRYFSGEFCYNFDVINNHTAGTRSVLQCLFKNSSVFFALHICSSIPDFIVSF